MRQPLHRRAAALLWALAFVFGTVGEGFGLRACPHHDGGGAHAAAPITADAADHGNHGSHGGAAAARGTDGHCGGGEGSHGSDTHAPGNGHDGPCTCGAACQMGTAAALPVVPHAGPTVTVSTAAATRIRVGAEPRLQRPPHFLPFSLAPPLQG